MLFIFVAVYFLPAIVAGSRNHRQALSIQVLNLFLGWTFIGWVVALVWAVSAQPESGTQQAEKKPFTGGDA